LNILTLFLQYYNNFTTLFICFFYIKKKNHISYHCEGALTYNNRVHLLCSLTLQERRWRWRRVGSRFKWKKKGLKVVIPISYLYHPLFKHLLDNGYHTEGPLKLPCSVDDFLHLRERIHYPSPPTSSSSSWPTSSRLVFPCLLILAHFYTFFLSFFLFLAFACASFFLPS